MKRPPEECTPCTSLQSVPRIGMRYLMRTRSQGSHRIACWNWRRQTGTGGSRSIQSRKTTPAGPAVTSTGSQAGAAAPAMHRAGTGTSTDERTIDAGPSHHRSPERPAGSTNPDRKESRMAEYINKADAIRAITIRKSPENSPAQNRMLSLIEKAIIRTPSADVAPVVHGVPVRKNRESKEVIYLQEKEENGEILYKRYVYTDKTDWVEYCSVCGKRLCSRYNNFCPNCGAKMDLEG